MERNKKENQYISRSRVVNTQQDIRMNQSGSLFRKTGGFSQLSG